MKRTRIVCTIGPASRSEDTLRSLIEAGMDVARINFSHGTPEEHAETCRRVRALSERVALMQDLQGPKIRLGMLQEGGIAVEPGAEVTLAAAAAAVGGDIPVDYPELAGEVGPGDDIFIADGLIHLQVERVAGERIVCRVLHGGVLDSRKGVNIPGARIGMPALTEQDREDLACGIGIGVDYVALSFVRRPDEVAELRGLIEAAGSRARVVAKIEKREALENLDAIVDQADAVMIARGDLGVEIPIERVPVVQKQIVARCLERGRPVITATQMLESMVSSKLPTRAEASDVANAIFDGSDAVMLSAETAIGIDPARTVGVMRRIIEEAEKYALASRGAGAPGAAENGGPAEIGGPTDAVCAGAVKTAAEVGARAIGVLTHTGRTARYIARRRPRAPIVALTDSPEVVRQMSLVWGVEAIQVEGIYDTERIFAVVRDKLAQAGYRGTIVLTAGIPTRERRPTNTIHVIDI